MLLEVQAPPEEVEENVVVRPIQAVCVPESVPAEGAAVTVTIVFAVASAHPPVPVTV